MEPIFTKPIEQYKNYLNPVNDSIKQMSTLMATMYNLTYEEAAKLVIECIKEKKIKNPIVRYKERQDNGDVVIEQKPITGYIKDVKDSKDIIVPSFTVYTHPDKEESIISSLLFENVAKRNVYKKEMFKAERAKDEEKENFFNNNQKAVKVENNAASGGFGSNGTVIYNPSAHYTLTSITRCVSGLGNAISEIIVGGNKYFRNPDVVLNYIAVICTYTNLKKCEEIITKYNLHYPTPEETLKVVKKTSRWYWSNAKVEEYILSVFKRITPLQRACFVYVNDLWNIKEFNEDFTRTLLDRLHKKVTSGSTDPLKDLDNSIDGTNVLAHHIYASEIQGLDINYSKLLENNDPLVYKLASTAKNIKETLIEYRDFFQAFFVTEILPTNTAYIQDMLRFNIVLSDTDSTCCSYDKWVKWFFGELRFDDPGIGLAAAVMTITTQVMDHNIKFFSKNMNNGVKKQYKLAMKNEFYWPVFVTADVTKHYYASTMIQEGNVFDKLKLEKKGVHFIASTIGGDIVKKVNEKMMWIMEEVRNNRKISIVQVCNEIADMEMELLNDFHNNKYYMFRRETIKEEKAYRQAKEESKFINHLLWMEVFADQFGSPSNPPYPVYIIGLTVKSKKDFHDMLNNISKTDPEISRKLNMFCTKYKKEYISTLRIPKALADIHGIPKAFIPYVDIKETILQALRPFEYILKTLGYYKLSNYYLSELGFGTIGFKGANND